MEWIVGLVLVSTLGWLGNNWIRAKHGYDLEDEWGGKTGAGGKAEVNQLRDQNRQLAEKVDAMQERLVVLEKIVTDRSYSLAGEIEALRDTGAGVPLNIGKKEQA
jgi:hypothetical protein